MNFSITALIAVAVIALLFKFATRIAAKILGFFVVIALVFGFMYYESIGPFKENMADIAHLKGKYCEEERDASICDCIIGNAEKDMRNRFTKDELDSLAVQRIKAAYVLNKSLNATKEEALLCLAAKGEEEKYKVFLQDFVPIENEYLDLIGEKAKQASEKIRDEYQSFKDNKGTIDSKY
jgi:hypothetical protein